MKVKILDATLNGNLTVPKSKSYLHRVMIAHFLATNQVINLDNLSEDIKTTANLLSAIKEDQDDLYFSESASSLRFLIPIISAITSKEKKLHLGSSLNNRPISPFQDLYNKMNISFIKKDHHIIISGNLYPSNYHIDGSISSQFISGLLMALPLLDGDSKIIIDNELVSNSYVNMTLHVLKLFKISIVREDNIFYIKGNQKYQETSISIEGDYSQAAFFIVAGAINELITISNLKEDSYQGDKKIIDIINNMGGNVSFINNQLVSKKGELHGNTIDLKDNIDLGPILFSLAAVTKDKTIIKNVKRLKYKESNRLDNMIKNLIKMKANIVKLDENTIMIQGKGKLSGNIELETFNDHRIVMALSIIKKKVDGYIILDNYEAVSKSYPDFFKDFVKLGGKIDVK
ncbi:hypothetical protein LJC17_02705 [Acholeplasma sp. OttesenSCG-928-E16]|nr:hypothetical protein [Acholeplasma sp. OttesenSCG-928-E16]